MGGRIGTIGTVIFAAGMLAAGASAAPLCNPALTTDLGGDGKGLVFRPQVVSGFCVQAGDTLYGNFNLGNLPDDLVLLFNHNPVSGLTRYQLSFDGTYDAGTVYNWGYEVGVSPLAGLGTVIVSLDSDFTQTVGTSILDKVTDPTTLDPIHMVKDGAVLQPGSNNMTTFGSGITNLGISETLNDNGTVSSVTNTVVVFTPDHNFPEPASIALFGAALAGAGWMRRKNRT